jgi:hypothetical protein
MRALGRLLAVLFIAFVAIVVTSCGGSIGSTSLGDADAAAVEGGADDVGGGIDTGGPGHDASRIDTGKASDDSGGDDAAGDDAGGSDSGAALDSSGPWDATGHSDGSDDGGAPVDTGIVACIPSCATDLECQASCPASNSALWCCDIGSATCYETTASSCPTIPDSSID